MIGRYEQIDLQKMIEGKFWWSEIKKIDLRLRMWKKFKLDYFILLFVTFFLIFIGHLISPA